MQEVGNGETRNTPLLGRLLPLPATQPGFPFPCTLQLEHSLPQNRSRLTTHSGNKHVLVGMANQRGASTPTRLKSASKSHTVVCCAIWPGVAWCRMVSHGRKGVTRPHFRPPIKSSGMGWYFGNGSRLSALGSRLSALGSRLSALGSRLSALGSRLSALR
jgi:hypothetical protein